MQTRQTRAIIWTDYPTAADAAALAELDAEQDADKRAEIAGRIAPATQTRITFSVLSALQFARYQAAIDDVRAWIEEEIGADKADKQMWTYGLVWAQMRGAPEDRAHRQPHRRQRRRMDGDRSASRMGHARRLS